MCFAAVCWCVTEAELHTTDAAVRAKQPVHHSRRMVRTLNIDDLVATLVLPSVGVVAAASGSQAQQPPQQQQPQQQPIIQTVVLDVEGFEQQALAGGRHVIASRQVLFWQVEVWLILGGQVRWKNEAHFAGLHLLAAAGYGLFTVYINGRDPYVAVPSVHDLLELSGTTWCTGKFTDSEEGKQRIQRDCAIEVFAVHPDHVSAWQPVWRRRQALYP
jgi:hypothetical protein